MIMPCILAILSTFHENWFFSMVLKQILILIIFQELSEPCRTFVKTTQTWETTTQFFFK